MFDPAPLLLVTNLLTLGLAAAWYAWPALKKLPMKDAMTLLLLPHTMRFIGLLFQSEGAVQRPLAPEFVEPAALGDVSTALLAWIAVLAVRMGWPRYPSFAAVIHGVGVVDLVYAVSMGVLHNAPADMGATIWIPILIVPMLLVTHVLAIGLLCTCKQHRRAEEKGPAMGVA